MRCVTPSAGQTHFVSEVTLQCFTGLMEAMQQMLLQAVVACV